MNVKTVESLVTTIDLADVVGVEPRAIRKTYLNNPKKESMVQVLAFGTYLKKHKLTSNEVKDAVEYIKAQRLNEMRKVKTDVG